VVHSPDKELENSLKSISKGAVFAGAGAVTAGILGYILKIVVARVWGVEEYGLFSLGLTVCSLASVIALFGLPIGVTRFIAFYRGRKEPAHVRETYTVGLKTGATLSLIVGGTIFFLSRPISTGIFHEEQLSIMVRVFALSIPAVVVLRIFQSVLHGFEAMRQSAIIKSVIREGLFLLFVVFLVLVNASIVSVAYAYLASLTAAGIVGYFAVKKYTSPLEMHKGGGERISIRGKILFYSLPLIFTQVFLTIRYQIDKLMLGSMGNTELVGMYNSAVPTAKSLLLISGLFTPILFPVITKLYAGEESSRDVIKTVFQTVNRWIFYIMFPLILFLIWFPDSILNVLFGPAFEQASYALGILTIGVFAFLISGAGGTLLNAIGRTKLILAIETIGMGVNILLNFLLIPLYGIEGAAYATLASFLVNAVIVCIVIKTTMGFFPYEIKTVKYMIITGAVLGSVYFVIRAVFSEAPVMHLSLGAVFASLTALIVILKAVKLNEAEKNIVSLIKQRIKGLVKRS
jgi:O-antigen/teichoic acid export membrane protein